MTYISRIFSRARVLWVLFVIDDIVRRRVVLRTLRDPKLVFPKLCPRTEGYLPDSLFCPLPRRRVPILKRQYKMKDDYEQELDQRNTESRSHKSVHFYPYFSWKKLNKKIKNLP